MEALEGVAAVRKTGRSDLGQPGSVWPLAGGRWLLQCWIGDLAAAEPAESQLVVLDQTLEPVWRLRPPPELLGWQGTHAVADDLSLVALSLPREVRLVDGAGEPVARFPYPAEQDTGYAGFTDDGRHLSVQFPGRDELLTLDADGEVVERVPEPSLGQAGGCAFSADRRWLWAYVPHKGEGDELWLIELANLTVVDRRPVGFYAQRVLPYRHPDEQSLGLSLSAGPDSVIRWARPVDRRIDLRAVQESEVLADVHPAGREYLTIGADPARNHLTRRRYADDVSLAELPVTTGASEYEWGTRAKYLTGELLLAAGWWASAKRNRHILLRRDPLVVLGWVDYPDGYGTPPGDIGACRDGTWLTLTDDTVECWTLPSWPGQKGSAP